MGYFRLERVEAETNRYRFYLVTYAPTLWKTWAVSREWGRIGEDARGTQVTEFPSEDQALHLTSEIIELRLKHGYSVKSVPARVSEPEGQSMWL